MIRRKTVLTVMAIGVLAALALPATASAEWKHNHVDIPEPTQFGLTGQAKFQATLGSVECQVTSNITIERGARGTVQTFVPHPIDATTNCKGAGGLAFCQIHDLTGKNLSWIIHTAEFETTQLVAIQGGHETKPTGVKHQAVVITSKGVTSQLTGAFCPVKDVTVTEAAIGAIPNQPNTITDVQLSGIQLAHLQTSSGVVDKEHVVVSGTLNLEPKGGVPQQHTYSI